MISIRNADYQATGACAGSNLPLSSDGAGISTTGTGRNGACKLWGSWTFRTTVPAYLGLYAVFRTYGIVVSRWVIILCANNKATQDVSSVHGQVSHTEFFPFGNDHGGKGNGILNRVNAEGANGSGDAGCHGHDHVQLTESFGLCQLQKWHLHETWHRPIRDAIDFLLPITQLLQPPSNHPGYVNKYVVVGTLKSSGEVAFSSQEKKGISAQYPCEPMRKST